MVDSVQEDVHFHAAMHGRAIGRFWVPCHPLSKSLCTSWCTTLPSYLPASNAALPTVKGHFWLITKGDRSGGILIQQGLIDMPAGKQVLCYSPCKPSVLNSFVCWGDPSEAEGTTVYSQQEPLNEITHRKSLCVTRAGTVVLRDLGRLGTMVFRDNIWSSMFLRCELIERCGAPCPTHIGVFTGVYICPYQEG